MMIELGAIRSQMGAAAQQLHSDTTPRWDRRDARLWTVFLPLQDISVDMGALQLCPATQDCVPDFGELERDTSKWCDQNCHTVTASVGDAVLMDSRVFHRANRHIAKTDRIVFYFSFVSADVGWMSPSTSRRPSPFPVGSTLAMHPRLWGSRTLASCRRSISNDSLSKSNENSWAIPKGQSQRLLSAAEQAIGVDVLGQFDASNQRRTLWQRAGQMNRQLQNDLPRCQPPSDAELADQNKIMPVLALMAHKCGTLAAHHLLIRWHALWERLIFEGKVERFIGVLLLFAGVYRIIIGTVPKSCATGKRRTLILLLLSFAILAPVAEWQTVALGDPPSGTELRNLARRFVTLESTIVCCIFTAVLTAWLPS